MNHKSTRSQIVEAADELFYRQGYEHTSFADIAEAVHISRGNFYYHFKSKDEILDAVIARRLADREKWLEEWDTQERAPADRIKRFIDILIRNRNDIKRYGCPIGTLCSELAKLEHPAQTEANMLFSLFRTWLRRQFELLGRSEDADTLAMHLLAESQGVATLANAFDDEKFIRREVQQMYEWLSECEKSIEPHVTGRIGLPFTKEQASNVRRPSRVLRQQESSQSVHGRSQKVAKKRIR